MTKRAIAIGLAAGWLAGAMGTAFAAPAAATIPARELRPLVVEVQGRWRGDAIAYGPHRDGQRPRGASPTRAQVREDLAILAKHYGLLRIYGAGEAGDTVLAAIRESGLGTKVLLGCWLAAEDRRDSTGRVLERFPAARAANRREIDATVRLAKTYPDLVAAIAVGNETQVFWSANRLPAARLIEALREVRARTRVPVTTSDDYNFWNKPESRAVAAACDFVSVHLHPLWNGTSLEGALPWVRAQFEAIRAAHPDRPVVIGETGWATRRNDQGDQGKLMKGELGEDAQAAYVRALREWVARERVVTFTFEAFDENWKGSDDPNEVEKHWGLWRADRSPKRVVEVGP